MLNLIILLIGINTLLFSFNVMLAKQLLVKFRKLPDRTKKRELLFTVAVFLLIGSIVTAINVLYVMPYLNINN